MTYETTTVQPPDPDCLKVRKWWCFLLSSIFTFLAGLLIVLIWRAFAFLCCRKEPEFAPNDPKQKEQKAARQGKEFEGTFMTEAKDWAGELISGQTTTGRILLIQRSPNLTNLRCICYEANCEHGLTEGILQAVGNYAIYLNRLHLRQMDARVSNHSIHCISTLSNLEYLKLERFDNVITDDLIVQLTSNCKNLRFVSFSGCPRVTNFGIDLIMTTLQYLEDVEIFHSNVSELVPSNSSLILSTLKRLYIVNCPNLTQDALCQTIAVLPNIVTLFVSQCKLAKSTIAFIILSTISRNKNFILKKWKALNTTPFRVIVRNKEKFIHFGQQNNDRNMRFLIYDNEDYDDVDISTNVDIALFLQRLVSTDLKHCEIVQ